MEKQKMSKKKIMWWNLPPEEIDELKENNGGKLTPFAHVEVEEEEIEVSGIDDALKSDFDKAAQGGEKNK